MESTDNSLEAAPTDPAALAHYLDARMQGLCHAGALEAIRHLAPTPPANPPCPLD